MEKFWDFKSDVKIRLTGEILPSFRVVSQEEADRLSKPIQCPLCEAGVPVRRAGEKGRTSSSR